MKMKTDAVYLALSKNQNLHFEMNLNEYGACRGQLIKICPHNAPKSIGGITLTHVYMPITKETMTKSKKILKSFYQKGIKRNG